MGGSSTYIYNRSQPTFLARNSVHLDVAHTHPLPVSAARSAPRAACLLLPWCPTSFAPPIFDLGLYPGPCWPLGVRLQWFPPSLCIPPPSPCDYPNPVIFWALVSLGVLFTRGRWARMPPLPGSRSSRPPPPRYMTTPAPSGYPKMYSN